MQRLLNSARWDADAVRDALRAYVVEHLSARDGVLIATGALRPGSGPSRNLLKSHFSWPSAGTQLAVHQQPAMAVDTKRTNRENAGALG
jgi:hypothetical protein